MGRGEEALRASLRSGNGSCASGRVGSFASGRVGSLAAEMGSLGAAEGVGIEAAGVGGAAWLAPN
jgi:hypothetical protein